MEVCTAFQRLLRVMIITSIYQLTQPGVLSYGMAIVSYHVVRLVYLDLAAIPSLKVCN